MERAEFERLALEHLDAVYRLSFQLTRSGDEAQDLAQEVYLRVLQGDASERFESGRSSRDGAANGHAERAGDDERSRGESANGRAGGGMRAWLFTITHHAFYSRARHAKRGPAVLGEFHAETSPDRLPDEPPPAWDLASLNWEYVDSRLKGAIERLKPEYREVLLLWGVEGLKYRHIAEIVGVPIGTVMSRLHRARKILADELGGEEGPAALPGAGAHGGIGGKV